jgi:hypothetical protein
LLCEGTKPGPGGNGSLLLTPLELLDRLAALVPPPRIHRHRFFGADRANDCLPGVSVASSTVSGWPTTACGGRRRIAALRRSPTAFDRLIWTPPSLQG